MIAILNNKEYSSLIHRRTIEEATMVFVVLGSDEILVAKNKFGTQSGSKITFKELAEVVEMQAKLATL